jgi:hypothetical protein
MRVVHQHHMMMNQQAHAPSLVCQGNPTNRRALGNSLSKDQRFKEKEHQIHDCGVRQAVAIRLPDAQ